MTIGNHPWRARVAVGLSMLILSFFGLIFTAVWQDRGFFYWLILTPILALSCLWLSWYLRRKEHSLSLVDVWHELLHWAALFAAVCLIWELVKMGILGRFEAGLVIVSLLALTTFIAGIYIETSYIVIGLALGLVAWGGGLAQQYLYYILIPGLLLLAAGIVWIAYKVKHKEP